MNELARLIALRAASNPDFPLIGEDWDQVLPEDLVSFGIRLEDVSLFVEVEHAWECFIGQAEGGIYDTEHEAILLAERRKYPELAQDGSMDGFCYFAVTYSRLGVLDAMRWWHRKQTWALRVGLTQARPLPSYSEFALVLRQRKSVST